MGIAEIIHQKPYEDRIAVFHRHSAVLAWSLLGIAVLAAVPAGVYLFLRSQFPEVLAHPIGFPALALAASAYEIGVWLFAFTVFLDHELDMWVVTNDRFINIEQQGLFSRRVAELDLWRVQDVTSEAQGVLPTLLNYGTVYVQTAGARERFVLEQVPHPHEVRKLILDMAEVDREYHAKDIAMIQKIATTA